MDPSIATQQASDEFMPSLHVPRCKNRKLTIICLIVIILLGTSLTYQSFIRYFDSIKQSRIYLEEKPLKGNSTSIQRAILIFYPSTQESHYLPEVRWLYRSWLEMMKVESKEWRTDFIIYTEYYSSSLQQLGCVLNEVRMDDTEPPQCRVFPYLRISNRTINSITQRQTVFASSGKSEFFQINTARSIELYREMQKYGYIDSVNIIAEAYPTFQYYDFILKTDIDVFITKQFAKYTPVTKNTFLVGLGGYSTQFNTRRLGRVARDMNWHHPNITNIGSTWYGPPYIAQRIANFTLDAMLHLYIYEFTKAEHEQKVGTILWPDWHYGVLSMYGTHLAVNHLFVSDKFDIKKADQLLDQSTTNKDPFDLQKNNRLHLHCWHTEQPFSKFAFKDGRYNKIHPRTLYNDTSAQAYAMRMALESRLMTVNELGQRLHDIGDDKIAQIKL
ncbi:unnamed protein product [Adineta ricciae]|uniref:DUF7164 domain-containing protein n=1 Tax=Adineta ricciae TaxID=249248 RepID=A0A814SH45_ADIRI|nr:unnamed protein product [Adineta ricciae]